MARKFFGLILTLAFMAQVPQCLAEQSLNRVELSDPLNETLIYLLSFADPDKQPPAQIDPDRIDILLNFVLADKPRGQAYVPEKIRSAPAAYMEERFNVSLKQLLALAYNPRIPSVLTAPNSVRKTQWRKVNGKLQQLPDMQTMLEHLQTPVVLTGVEFIENTPDTFSGAYYDYELNRTLILMKHRNRNVFISLSSQRDKSGVGKKGIITGEDRNLDYVYTGKPGLNMAGIGWVKSYMYDSMAVTVYCELNSEVPAVKAGFFKWVRAGWAGLNIVRTDHIYSGLKRFLPNYKKILESEESRRTAAIESMCDRIESLSTEQLRQTTRNLFNRMIAYYTDDPEVSIPKLKKILLESNYVDDLGRLDMQSLLLVEYAKQLLGLAYHTDVRKLSITGMTPD